MISSPLRRCLDTVAPFIDQHGFDLGVRDDLRERLISQSLIADFTEIWSRSWDDFHFALPECESSDVAQQRMLAAMLAIAQENPERRIPPPPRTSPQYLRAIA